MSKELLWLTLTIALTGLLWIPYIIDRAQVRGLWASLDNPKPGDTPQSP
ncbi:MAG: MAPEG family protein, partial [Xanthobacteraceae bacterium]|nr:MAPEG family protein [Xanthobacteraceae bacterium]